MGRHRNSQKRIYIPGATYFITTVTHGRFPYFEEEIFRKLFVDELLFCSELESFAIFGYAVMPDHAHLLIRPTGGFTYSQIMHFIKRHCARNANFIMGYARPDDDDECAIHPLECAPEGAIGQSRLRGRIRGDARLNEFLMKIRNYREKFVARHGDRSPFPPFRLPKATIRIVAVPRSHYPRHGRSAEPPRIHRAAMFASWVRRERVGGRDG